MKVLQINKFYYLKGGAERHLFEVSKLLSQNGHTVIPFSMHDPKNQSSTYSKYFVKAVDFEKFSISAFLKFFYNWEAVKQLERLISDEQPDIAHLHNVAHQLTPSIIRVLKKHSIPVVLTLHDYQPICPNYQLYTKGKYCEGCKGGNYFNCVKYRCAKDSYIKSIMSAFELYLHRRIMKNYDLVDQFIAPSQFMADVSVAFGLPKEKMTVVYNFLGDEQKRELEQPSTDFTDKYLLYFGRLTEEKGVMDLINAMAENITLSLKIVGAGPEEDELKAAVLEKGLDDRIEFLGYQDGSVLMNLIKQATAVVLPARWPENMPYCLVEALAAGRPLVVSRMGGLTELVENGKNGFLFTSGNVVELSEKLHKIEKSDLKLMESASKELVKKFESGQYYQKISEIYNKLI